MDRFGTLPLIGGRQWHLSRTLAFLAALIVTTPTLAHAVVDTIYVDNTKTCPGGPGTTLTNAYCSIVTALANTGGADKVVAVVATGTTYRETGPINITAADSGTVGHPFVLLARGAVTIDAADATSSWTPVPANSTMWRTSVPAAATTVTQVFLDGVPYPYVRYTDPLPALPAGRCQIAGSVDSVYVNFGAHPNWPSVNPTGTTGYVTLRTTIVIAGSNVTVDGFTIRRSSEDGIHITGPVRNVTIANCDVRGSYRQGIMPNNVATHHCTIKDNIASANGSYGIWLPNANTDFSVLRNTCASNLQVLAYLNNQVGRSPINGIRLGDRSTALDPNQILHHNHLLEGNVASHNQDSGIEIRTNYTTSRNNQSWSNQDHGFDHQHCTNVTHTGDLSWGNNRDGMSFESDTHNQTLRNCVIANNGRDRCRRDWELEVYPTAKLTWSSDYDVIWRNTVNEPADTVLINFHGGPANDSCNTSQCTYSDSCFKSIAAFRVKFPAHEGHAHAGEPTFADSAAGKFIPLITSSVLDAANSGVSGWPVTDIRGFGRHDFAVYPSIPDSGTGPRTYDDIGPYELGPPGPPTIAVDYFGYTDLQASWTARGDEWDVGTAQKYELIVNGVVKASGSAGAPGAAQSATATGLTTCTVYRVKITSQDNVRAEESNTVTGNTCCTPPPLCGIERPGGGPEARGTALKEDFPLDLGRPEPSPARGASTVSWSIPRAQAGARYELSLFDVAGRRVLTIAKGTAKAGKFTRELSFRSDRGLALQSGVYFMRFRIADQVLARTVVLAR